MYLLFCLCVFRNFFLCFISLLLSGSLSRTYHRAGASGRAGRALALPLL